eukprot:2788521-Prymnesium_polylepis.1
MTQFRWPVGHRTIACSCCPSLSTSLDVLVTRPSHVRFHVAQCAVNNGRSGTRAQFRALAVRDMAHDDISRPLRAEPSVAFVVWAVASPAADALHHGTLTTGRHSGRECANKRHGSSTSSTCSSGRRMTQHPSVCPETAWRVAELRLAGAEHTPRQSLSALLSA